MSAEFKSSKHEGTIDELLQEQDISNVEKKKDDKTISWQVNERGLIYSIFLDKGFVLQFRAIFERPPEIARARSLLFANAWNHSRRFTKACCSETELTLVLDIDLRFADPARLKLAHYWNIFRVSLVPFAEAVKREQEREASEQGS